MDQTTHDFPLASRRLRLGFVGGGQGALIGEVHANGARLSNRWDIVAGALSSKPERAKVSGKVWLLAATRREELYDCHDDQREGIPAVVAVCLCHTGGS